MLRFSKLRHFVFLACSTHHASRHFFIPSVYNTIPPPPPQQLNDSSMVMSALYSYLYDPSRSLPELASYYPPLTATDRDGRRRTDIMNKYFLMYGDRDTARTKDDIK